MNQGEERGQKDMEYSLKIFNEVVSKFMSADSNGTYDEILSNNDGDLKKSYDELNEVLNGLITDYDTKDDMYYSNLKKYLCEGVIKTMTIGELKKANIINKHQKSGSGNI